MLKHLFPAYDWLAGYQRRDFNKDVVAGIIVAVMLIPQGMAYAMLAGLPPVMGLYAATIPLIIYAFFATSRHLSVGPVAMISLLVFTGVSNLATPGTAEYISYVILLMLMVGMIQFLMGILKLGFMVNFLSHAVISAFTTAAAIIIGLSQVKHLLGIPLSAESTIGLIWTIINSMVNAHTMTLTIGVVGILMLIMMKKYIPKLPGPLVVVVSGILFVQLLQLEQRGVHVVGVIPEGLPGLSLPVFSVEVFLSLLPMALTISIIGFVESMAMAKVLAAKEKYRVYPNKELVGLGLANAGGAFFSGFPVTGGFSRSAVNHQAGAKTPLASLITAVVIILTLLFFTPLFYHLPHAILAAIILVAVYGLLDFKEAIHLFRLRRRDGVTWLITFLSTLFIGIEQGILIGVLFSILVFVWRSAYPHMAELGYLEKEQVFRNIKRFPQAIIDPEVLIFRVDASLYFANITLFEDNLRKKIKERSLTKQVVLDFSGVNSIDSAALHMLEELINSLKKESIMLLMTDVKGPVLDVMRKDGWDKKYPKHVHYLTLEQAMAAIKIDA